MIYFDNAATSLHKPKAVKQAINYALDILTANPGRSGHQLSNMVAEYIYDTREKVKHFFHASQHNVIFTKNCTEALNLAILGTLNKGDHVICTRYEHNSVLRTINSMQEDIQWTIIDDEMSRLPELIEDAIQANTKLVVTTHISNVTGEVCDISRIGRMCREKDIIYLVDGAQSSGHIQIDLDNAGVDMFACAGHKGLLAITGVGCLVIKDGIKLHPILYGGTGTDSNNLDQPMIVPEGFEAGTLPTIPILSLRSGIEFLEKNLSKIIKYEKNLTKYAYFALKKLDFLKIYSVERSLNVISFNVNGMDSNEVANDLNEKYSICVRSGLHCAPLIHKALDNMQGCVRVSLDFNNTEAEIDQLCVALAKIYSSYS